MDKRLLPSKSLCGSCLFLLWLIGKKESHGYQIIKKLKGEGISIGPSKLYPLLGEMLSGRIICQKKKRTGRRVRKVYAITEKGRQLLKDSKRIFKRGIVGEFIEEMLA